MNSKPVQAALCVHLLLAPKPRSDTRSENRGRGRKHVLFGSALHRVLLGGAAVALRSGEFVS